MSTAQPPSGQQWTIASGQHRAVVVEVGGGLRAYEVGDWQVLDGYAESEIAPGAAGQILAPWPNRIRDGQYAFGGRTHSLALTEPEMHNAAHGLVRWLPWTADESTPAQVRLGCFLPAQPGYPWSLHLTTTWSVGPDGLRAVHTATNLSAEPCPFGLGLHPYVQLPGVEVNDILLTVAARTRLAVDDRLLPTGTLAVAGTEYDFASPRPIEDRLLDTAFCDREDGDVGVRIASADGSSAVSVWADDAFRWWQVFTGDTLPGERHRRSVAVEPMTCPPDAFRSGRDVISLQPGQTWQGTWGITPTRM
jgi:aldose 1-epimerase